MSPLGLPKTPPAIPAFPGFILPPAAASVQSVAAAPARAFPPFGPPPAFVPPPAPEEPWSNFAADLARADVAPRQPAAEARAPVMTLDSAALDDEDAEYQRSIANNGGDWTPIDEQKEDMKKERRAFFYGEGKALTANYINSRHVDENMQVEVGQEVELSVVDIHFANPRIRILNKDPAPMPQMLKWPPEKFLEFRLECGQVSFGDKYKVWCAFGITSNRLLYAMKRSQVETAKAIIVTPPPPPDGEDDVDLTYGASVQGIQLVP